MKTTYAMAYKLASPLWGKKHVEGNAHWDCSLKSSCGKRPPAQNAKAGKSKALQAEKKGG